MAVFTSSAPKRISFVKEGNLTSAPKAESLRDSGDAADVSKQRIWPNLQWQRNRPRLDRILRQVTATAGFYFTPERRIFQHFARMGCVAAP